MASRSNKFLAAISSRPGLCAVLTFEGQCFNKLCCISLVLCPVFSLAGALGFLLFRPKPKAEGGLHSRPVTVSRRISKQYLVVYPVWRDGHKATYSFTTLLQTNWHCDIKLINIVDVARLFPNMSNIVKWWQLLASVVDILYLHPSGKTLLLWLCNFVFFCIFFFFCTFCTLTF
jgi:hypothetical protein